MGQNIKVKRFQFEFTRPANTTAYAVQDGVSDLITNATLITWRALDDDGGSADNALVKGGSYQIKLLKLTKSTNSTTNASFDLYCYTSGVTATADNVEAGLFYGNKHVRIGKSSFTLSTAGTTQSDCAEAVNTDVNLTFKARGTTFYSQIVAAAAYAPGNAEKFYGQAELIELNG